MNPDIYPFQGGVGLISQKLAELCRSRAIKITCNARVEQVLRLMDGSYEIHYQDSQNPAVFYTDYVISTIPLEELARTARMHAGNPDRRRPDQFGEGNGTGSAGSFHRWSRHL
jgi:protoporphyrinogen oxidase